MRKIIILLAVLLFSSALNLSATPISDVSRFAVGGGDMAGMVVTVTYNDPLSNPSSTDTWEAAGVNSGGASADGWGLTFNYPDTYFYDNSWVFSLGDNSAAVKSFTINAIPGNTVFDILFVGPRDNLNTDGSELGWWQEIGEGNPYNNGSSPGDEIFGIGPGFSWSFTDPITLGGVVAGDLFGQLSITFVTALNGGDTFSFKVDTDNVAPVLNLQQQSSWGQDSPAFLV